jgi:hypothetical protein
MASLKAKIAVLSRGAIVGAGVGSTAKAGVSAPPRRLATRAATKIDFFIFFFLLVFAGRSRFALLFWNFM